MGFTPEKLLQVLDDLPHARRYWVAYSGGLDSHVLLHALATARDRTAELAAVHIHHGLSADADQWVAHCRRVCADLGVALEVVHVDARAGTGDSPEARARDARYRALAERVRDDEMVLSAHHRDDQAETLLLQLIRGAGLQGLAAMPALDRLGRGRLARPLLGFDRAQLRAYAMAHGLRWVEDASNASLAFDRNFLRHQVLAPLRARWPAVATTLARSAEHCAAGARLNDLLAEQDLAAVAAGDDAWLSVPQLQRLAPERRRNALRFWIRRRGLPVPATTHLHRPLAQLLDAAWDATPCVHWPGGELRRHRDRLYALAPLADHDPAQRWPWNPRDPLPIPPLGGVLRARPATGTGLAAEYCRQAPLTVGFRRGGERCRESGRGCSHSLKKLFQERGIPPWQRDRIPLVYVNDALAAVPGLWVCEPFAASPGGEGYIIEWRTDCQVGDGTMRPL